jgi:hypothetical protein
VKLRRALWISHMPGRDSSIQWPITAKYASVFDACHASHVRLISTVTALLYTTMLIGEVDAAEIHTLK